MEDRQFWGTRSLPHGTIIWAGTLDQKWTFTEHIELSFPQQGLNPRGCGRHYLGQWRPEVAEKTVLPHGGAMLGPHSPVQWGFLGRTVGHVLASDGARIIIPSTCSIHLHRAGLWGKGSDCKHFCKLLELPSCCLWGLWRSEAIWTVAQGVGSLQVRVAKRIQHSSFTG